MRKSNILKIVKNEMEKIKEAKNPTKPKESLFFKIKFKYKIFISYIKQLLNKLRIWYFSESTQEITHIVKYVIGYGILGYLTYYSLFIRHNIILTALGFGSLQYLFTDNFDFVWERIKLIWERVK